MDTDREIQRAIDIGQANKEVLELAQNWCAHLTVESWGGVGLVEQMTGLPIGIRRIRCPYARAVGIAAMDLEHVALDFYDRNCVGCKERRPVRLPNLLQLVEKRDTELKCREERARLAAKEEAARVEARASRRRILREGVDSAKAGIFDILDQLDQAPTEADCRILVETARAAADKFDTALQEALVELAEAGGWVRTEAALEALAIVTSDRTKLTEVALGALARGDAMRTAGSIVSRWLDASHKDLLPLAIPALIHLASPILDLTGIPGSPGDPMPLLAAYRLFPDIVHASIRELLRFPDKHLRIDACNAAASIIEIDPDFGPRVADDLIWSVGLPDDHYDGGSAGDVVARTLAGAMKVRPTEIDTIVHGALATASDAKRGTLFRVYTWLLRPQWNAPQRSVTPADELAFRRIVEVLTQRPTDKRFEEAAFFFRDQAKYYPTLIESHAETLLGAAALISGDLDNPYSPLLDPRPSALKALEAQTRQIHLNTALDAIVQAVGWAAARQPRSIGRQVLHTLEHLGETHDRLKAALVRSLGIMGRSREGLAVALPALYTAMMDRSQRVRAAAATAYGELAEGASEDLPSLVHESFLVLLLDPYVVVHNAAIRALRRVRLPTRFRVDALSRVAMLIAAYSASRDNDELLSEWIERFIELCNRADALIPQTLQVLIATIGRMEPWVAARLVKYHSWRLRTGPGFADLVVKLLGDPSTYEWDLHDLVEELTELPTDEIRRLAGAIKAAAAACARRGAHLTDDLLEILTTASAWSAAVEVAREATNQLEDTRWDRPRKLRARARQVAAELELAAATGQTAQVLACTAQWLELQQEIKKDDEENKEARSPLRGLRLPSSSE